MRWSNLARSALFSVAICCVIPEAEAVEVFAAPGFAAQADMVTPARFAARGGAAVRGPRGGVAVRGGSVRGGAYRGGAYRGGAVYRGGAYRGYGYRGYGYRPYGYGAAAVGAAAARRCWIDEYGTRVCHSY
jgi:hypothetical protein